MTDNPMTAKHLLDQIVRGLDGEAREYLIKKGPYFYRKDKSGYTEFKFDAGRYTKEDAEREAEIEPWHMKAIHQDDVPDKTDPDKFIREIEARATAAEATVTALQEALAKAAEALEKIADLTARCEHDGGFDREIGPIGCNLGDKCLCIGLHPIARTALSQIRSEK